METIQDITAEMREFADVDAHTIGRDVLRRRIQHFARRIDEATAQCNQLKMREALEWCRGFMHNTADDIERIDAALSTPPRNCDRYPTLAIALEAWRDIDPREAGTFDDWLFAEAKGENDEQ